MANTVRLARATAHLLLCTLLAGMTACATNPPADLSQLAGNAGVAERIVAGRQFRHRLFTSSPSGAGQPLLIFLEGDGQPWEAGMIPARDPSPRQPLAFELFLATRPAAWYLTRPCYSGLNDADCRPELWTSARYSAAVVDSMGTALRSALEQASISEVVLVGYSGGGVLAALLAEQLPQAKAMITISANLDVAAWTRLHRYQPLQGSRDPARVPGTKIPHLALVGEKDLSVPYQSITGYLATHPDTLVQRYEQYDHVCCWRRDWNSILPAALQRLGVNFREYRNQPADFP